MPFLILCLLIPLFVFASSDEEELIPSTSEQRATLASDADTLIGGLVSPLSGHLSLKKTDLIVKGAQSISLTRVYIPPYMPCCFPQAKQNQEECDKLFLYRYLTNQYQGWQFFPHQRLDCNHKGTEVRLTSLSGITLDFTITENETELASAPLALSNVVSDEPSGKYDLRNTKITYTNNQIKVHAPDGTLRIYENKRLQKERLPNGKILKYHYNDQKQLSYIESLDTQERYVYASLRIQGSPKEGNCHFIASSGLSADYHYSTRPMHVSFKEKKHKEEFSSQYPPILTHVSSPFYRHLIIPSLIPTNG